MDQTHLRLKHTSLTPWKKRENKFIYALILLSKFNYMSSIIIISCFKYLLTLFMDDIGIIGSYLSYQWLIRLLCGSVPYTRRFPQHLRISLIRKYIINLTLYMLLINHLLTRFFVLTNSWRGYNILKGRLNSNNLNWIRIKVCNFFLSLLSLFINILTYYFLLNYSVINNQEAMSVAITLCNGWLPL